MPKDFPDLRIVSMDTLYFHEEVDLERVARLLDRLSADGLLRNPPIVASLSTPTGERYLLLDGANRVSAIQNMEIPHLLVQVEPFESSELGVSHWNHVVRDIEAETLIDEVSAIEGVDVVRDQEVRDGLLCSIILRDGAEYRIYSEGDLVQRVRSLGSICRLYHRGDARMDRVTHEDVEVLREHHPHFGALVVFPDIDKQDVRRVAECGERLPSGITRFLVPRRVLGFNLQLALLKSNLPLEDKRLWLGEAIQKKIADHKVRFYQEPIFVFDD